MHGLTMDKPRGSAISQLFISTINAFGSVRQIHQTEKCLFCRARDVQSIYCDTDLSVVDYFEALGQHEIACPAPRKDVYRHASIIVRK